MWKPKWLRKRPNLKTENVSYIHQYALHHEHDGTSVILTVHLPSKRVSEKYYDSSGNLKKYIHSSAVSDEHISFLCGKDSKLIDLIEEVNSTNTPAKHNSNIVQRMVGTSNYFHMALMVVLTILISWGFAEVMVSILE